MAELTDMTCMHGVSLKQDCSRCKPAQSDARSAHTLWLEFVKRKVSGFISTDDVAEFAEAYAALRTAKFERDILVCERAFQLQDGFEVEGRAGKHNALQISRAWLELEKRAETAEAKVAQLERERDALELKYRQELWNSHGHLGYGDDGELQCCQCAPFGSIDYKRDPLPDVENACSQARLVRGTKLISDFQRAEAAESALSEARELLNGFMLRGATHTEKQCYRGSDDGCHCGIDELFAKAKLLAGASGVAGKGGADGKV